MSGKSIRQAFIDRLKTMLFDHLYRLTFIREWPSQEVYNLSSSIVESKKTEIMAYLDTNQVTFVNVDKAMTEIMNTILVPEVSKMRI